MTLDLETEKIMKRLLEKQGITQYVVQAISEGIPLPGGSYPGEIKEISGTIITPTSIYSFWLEWNGNDYSLGEEDGYWGEEHQKDFSDAEWMRLMTIQAQLRGDLS